MADCVDCGKRIRFRDRFLGGLCETCRTRRFEASEALQVEIDRVSDLGFDTDLSQLRELEVTSGGNEEQLIAGRLYGFARWAEKNETRNFEMSDLIEATRAIEFTFERGKPQETESAKAFSFVISKFANSGVPVDFGLVELPLWKHEQPVFEIPATLLRNDLRVSVVKQGSGYTKHEDRVLHVTDQGTLTITSERVVFIGKHSSHEIQRGSLLNVNSNDYDLTIFLRYGSAPLIFRTNAPAPYLHDMVAFMSRGELNDPQTPSEAWSRIKEIGRAVKMMRRNPPA